MLQSLLLLLLVLLLYGMTIFVLAMPHPLFEAHYQSSQLLMISLNIFHVKSNQWSFLKAERLQFNTIRHAAFSTVCLLYVLLTDVKIESRWPDAPPQDKGFDHPSPAHLATKSNDPVPSPLVHNLSCKGNSSPQPVCYTPGSATSEKSLFSYPSDSSPANKLAPSRLQFKGDSSDVSEELIGEMCNESIKNIHKFEFPPEKQPKLEKDSWREFQHSVWS